MAIDWTIFSSGMGGITGAPEYRVESDGIVRWRGIITITADTLSYLCTLSIPAVANPIAGIVPAYVDFESGGKGLLMGPGLVYIGIAGGLALGATVDLLGVVYQGTPPSRPPSPHTLENVQAGLASALQTIVGLRVYDFPSDRVEPPAAVLSMPETPYDVTLGGRNDVWTFPLWVLVSRADDKAAYVEMVGYLEAEGAKSIRAAIEVDRTLGGSCDTAEVIQARPLFATVAGTEFLAVEFTLEVFT